MLERSPLQVHLRRTLADRANGNGGWPYYAGKNSRIEPTCWALLALADASEEDAAAWQRFAAPHVQWLAARQGGDGLLLDNAQAPPNLAVNGLAACVLAHVAKVDPLLARLLDGIAAVKGIAVDAPDPRQDNMLQGWPWMPDTFSWLEPTCWCLLALKKSGAQTRSARSRIQEAEKLIVNRSCETGGWNYGNASMFGQDLRPYVPTTALGLIAMQDRRTIPAVDRSLAYLEQARLRERSAMALALTAVCLRIYGLPVDEVEERLAGDADRAERIGNLQSLAMMLYALSGARHGAKALRVES